MIEKWKYSSTTKKTDLIYDAGEWAVGMVVLFILTLVGLAIIGSLVLLPSAVAALALSARNGTKVAKDVNRITSGTSKPKGFLGR